MRVPHPQEEIDREYMLGLISFRIVFFVLVFLWFCPQVWPGEPYKIYVVNKYGAWDIVCDRYKVNKGDHIWEILRRKGRIAEENFPYFVDLLKEMNPHIKDVDKIYPGQNIVIPLKQIAPQDRDTPKERGPRYVTIPMIPDVLFDYHRVQPGDYVSQIVTRHLDVSWQEIPDDYFETFSRLNPQIEDLDLIYPGQLVRIPELMAAQTHSEPPRPPVQQPVPDIESETSEISEVADSLPESEPVRAEESESATEPPPESVTGSAMEVAGSEQPDQKDTKDRVQPEDGPTEAVAESSERDMLGAKGPADTRQEAPADLPPTVLSAKAEWHDLMSTVAKRMGGRLLSSGYCYFPGKDGEDVPLDLSLFPVMELKDGRHVLFETVTELPKTLEETIRTAWKNLVVMKEEMTGAGRSVLDDFFEAAFGDRVRQSAVIPPFDDGIKAILGGDWVVPIHSATDQGPTYYAVTLVDDAKEKTSHSVVAYLAHKNIHVIDVTSDTDEEMQASGLAENGSQGAAVLTIETSGAEAFISALTAAMGYYYEPQVSIAFDYAGFQVQTSANIVYSKSGTDVVVDFGTFYGDAISSIEKGGMKVVSIGRDDKVMEIAKTVLEAVACSYTETPELFAADRTLDRTTALALPGLLIMPAGGEKGLLTENPIAPEIVSFLDERKITVWKFGER